MSITNDGLCISKELFASLLEKYKRKKFMIKERLPSNIPGNIQKHPRVLKLFKNINNDVVTIGRGLFNDLDLVYKFKKCNRFDHFDLGSNLGDHQIIVLRNIVERFRESKGAIYFCQMATGLGKTRLAISVIGKVGSSTLIIVPTHHIGNQWMEEINYLVPNIRVCLYNNKKDQHINDYDIFIIIVNTARTKG